MLNCLLHVCQRLPKQIQPFFFPGTTYKLIQTHTCTVTLLPYNDSFFSFLIVLPSKSQYLTLC
jgi:hypothetical protein